MMGTSLPWCSVSGPFERTGTSILLVEDFAPFRAFVTSLLGGNLDMQVFWASNGLEAVSLGARGYVAKQQSGRDLLPAVTAALQGKRFVSKGLPVSGFAPAKSPDDGAN